MRRRLRALASIGSVLFRSAKGVTRTSLRGARRDPTRIVPFVATALGYLGLLLLFSLIYRGLFLTSLGDARNSTLMEAHKTAWRIAIGLHVQSRPGDGLPQDEGGVSYRAAAWLAPSQSVLAFSFANAEDFVLPQAPLYNEIHAVADLSIAGSAGPAKSMPSGPWYRVYSWYHPYRLSDGSASQQVQFRYEDDPLAGSRFPYEIAPPGVFDVSDTYWSPPIGTAGTASKFSVSVPEDLFLEECVKHVESHLKIYIDREYEKWSSVGRLSTFLYFAGTFGLGEMGPASQAVRLVLIVQIVISVAFLAVMIPGLVDFLTRHRKEYKFLSDQANNLK